MIVRRLRLPPPPKIAEHIIPAYPVVDPIIQHETGGWTVGWHDDAPDFPTRNFAAQVAALTVTPTPSR
jgi:hypothetical protein